MECPSSNKHRDAVRKNDRLMQRNDSPNRDCGNGGDDDGLADAHDAVLLSTDTRRRLARRGGGVRDVSAFNSLFNAHYTPGKRPSHKKGKRVVNLWYSHEQTKKRCAHVKAQLEFKQTRGYDFYEYSGEDDSAHFSLYVVKTCLQK